METTMPLKVVAENDAKTLARNRALEAVSQCLKELTANLMRVSRGAGKPHDFYDHIAHVTKALVEYQALTGMFPSADRIHEILSVGERYTSRDGMEQDFLDGTEEVIRGALQMAASRLLQQKTQVEAGKSEMMRGVIAIEGVREFKRSRDTTTSRRPRKR
jgi:hypothetical protein